MVNLKDEWEIKKLGEVCEFRRGLTYSKGDEVPFSNNAVFRANNIDLETNTLNFNEIRYISDDIEIPHSKKLVKNSVMICTASGSKSHLGKVAFIDKDYEYAFGGFMGLLVPNVTIVDPKYFFIILTSGQFRDHVDSLTLGANINNLKFSQIQDYEVTIPPLAEQKRIVKILDEKFGAIEELKRVTEQQIADTKELFESRLNEIFHNDEWNKVAFEDVCVLQRGYDLPTRLRKEGVYPLLSANGVTDYIDQFKVKGPGVTTGRSGSIGFIHYIDSDFWPLNTALYIKDFKGNNEKFVYYFLRTFDLSRFSSGAGVPTLNRNHVHSEVVRATSNLNEQKIIVRELDELSEKTKALEAIFRRKIADLDELKKSYLEQAFSGKL